MDFSNAIRVLDSIGRSLPGIFTLLQVGLIIAAVLLAIKGVIELSQARKQHRVAASSSILSIIAGSLLISINQLLAVGSYTLFRTSQRYPILTTYEPGNGESLARIFYAVSAYLYLMGWFWMAYAIFKVHSGSRAQPQDLYWKAKALTAAALAIVLVNVEETTNILLNTVGQPPTNASYFQFNPS